LISTIGNVGRKKRLPKLQRPWKKIAVFPKYYP